MDEFYTFEDIEKEFNLELIGKLKTKIIDDFDKNHILMLAKNKGEVQTNIEILMRENKHTFIELCWSNNMIREFSSSNRKSGLYRIVDPMPPLPKVDKEHHLFEIIKMY